MMTGNHRSGLPSKGGTGITFPFAASPTLNLMEQSHFRS